MPPPFPFVGAGEASYGSSATVEIWFARVPTLRERIEIAAEVPEPLRDLTWRGRWLRATSPPHVAREIVRVYGGSRPRATRRAPTASQLARFNSAIAAWLMVTHATCPIAIAFRPTDARGGGTVYSRWHRDSVAMLPRLRATVARIPSERMVAGLLEHARVPAGKAPAIARPRRRRRTSAPKPQLALRGLDAARPPRVPASTITRRK